jgi:hypothetical protein
VRFLKLPGYAHAPDGFAVTLRDLKEELIVWRHARQRRALPQNP